MKRILFLLAVAVFFSACARPSSDNIASPTPPVNIDGFGNCRLSVAAYRAPKGTPTITLAELANDKHHQYWLVRSDVLYNDGAGSMRVQVDPTNTESPAEVVCSLHSRKPFALSSVDPGFVLPIGFDAVEKEYTAMDLVLFHQDTSVGSKQSDMKNGKNFVQVLQQLATDNVQVKLSEDKQYLYLKILDLRNERTVSFFSVYEIANQ